MKFKVKYEKSNFLFMSSIFFLCIVTCIFWLILREYIYLVIYLLLTLFVAYTYYFTFYYIKKDCLIIKMGLIKVKFKYKNIRKIENLKDYIKIHFNRISINLYPNNKDIFYAELNSKLTNKKIV